MKKIQLYRALIAVLPAVAFMLAFEIAFSFEEVTSAFQNFISGIESPSLLYLTVFIVMYLQGTIVPIPAYIPLNAAIKGGIIDASKGLGPLFASGETWLFMLVVLIAYLLGTFTAYFLGFFLGAKAVRWAASSQEDYEKWIGMLNKKGKWFYFLTVLLPVFPDDLLCICVGSLKMNLVSFFLSNFVGRSIGLVFSVGALAIVDFASSSFPTAAVAWGVAVIAIVMAIFFLRRSLKKDGELAKKGGVEEKQ